jgi:hypothetical protein
MLESQRINITGFAIGEKRDKVIILTSTQGIKAILSQWIGRPSIEEIDSLFKFEVKCLHKKERLKVPSLVLAN